LSKRKTSKYGKYLNGQLFTKFIYFEKKHSLNNAIILAGTGRSGTTWLADILSQYLKYRIIFEPFNPRKVKICKELLNKQYLSPSQESPQYYQICEKILKGYVRGTWVNRDNIIFRPEGRIVKTIRASLFLKWLKNNFPQIPIIYILRHPCAVVQSRIKLGWAIEEDLEMMLNQENLINDFLEPFIETIKSSKTPIQKTTCIWCIENYVALKSMEKEDWIVTTYEDLIVNKTPEIERIFNYLGFSEERDLKPAKNLISITVTKDSAVIKEKNPLESWRDSLNEDEINQILEIVKNFSLDQIYDYDLLPKKSPLMMDRG